MAKNDLSNVSIATFIGTSDPLTEQQLADLRSRFDQVVIDVLDIAHPELHPPEIFPVAFGAGRQAKKKKKPSKA